VTERDSSGIRVPPPLFYLAALAVGYVGSRLYPVAFLPRSLAYPLGGILLALWLIVSVPAIISFRRAGTSINPRVPTTALVTGGPYRFTRNPMYVGLTLFYGGMAMLLQTLWALVLLPLVLIVAQRLFIEREERYLEKKFGAEYRQYEVRVRRWL